MGFEKMNKPMADNLHAMVIRQALPAFVTVTTVVNERLPNAGRGQTED